jgi:hypothetical protein
MLLVEGSLDGVDEIQARCDQITETEQELVMERLTLQTLNVIKLHFFLYQNHNNPGFAMGGVETVVEIMNFSQKKCGSLQPRGACGVLRNLVCCSGICK